MSKDLLVLADEYAAATATFARALALKDSVDSMSPIAREAWGKRAVLAEALAALDTAQPVQVNALLVEDVNSEIVKRYKVEKTKGGFWPYCVKAGDGAMELFFGSRKQVDHVQQALQSACLDGAFMAITAAKQAQPVCGYDDETGNCTRVNCCKQAQPARPINCGTGHCSCIECPYEQAQPERAPIVWPKEKDVGRYGDMSPSAHLRVGLDTENDAYVSVFDENGGGTIEFCSSGGGGGKSSRTRLALVALMVAMEADNAECPELDWWARRRGIKQGGQHD